VLGRVLISVILLSFILTIGVFSPVFGAQLDVRVNPSADTATAKIIYQKTAFIEYEEGGDIANLLRGETATIEFTADDSTPGISDLKNQLNNYISSRGSDTRISNLDLEYSATLTGRGIGASMDYKIILRPTLENIVIREFSLNSPALVDVEWRGLTVEGPVTITSSEYGVVEINQPMSFIKSVAPSVASAMSGSEAEDLFEKPIIDAQGIQNQPMGNWHFLFDPTGINVDAATYGLSEEILGFVISSFTMGESSLREGIQIERIFDAEFTTDKTYPVRTVQSSDSATISVIGFAAVEVLSGQEVLGVSPEPPEGFASTSTGGFPVMIIYGMAGMAGMGAIVFLLFSSRQLKKHGDEGQTGIDPSQLTGYATSSASGGYQTNRGEAQLKSDAQYDQSQNVYEQNQQSEPQKESQSGGNKGGALPKGFKPK